MSNSNESAYDTLMRSQESQIAELKRKLKLSQRKRKAAKAPAEAAPKPPAAEAAAPKPEGQTRPAEQGMFTVSRKDYSNPEWMRANQGKVAEASGAGTLRFSD